MQVPFPLIIAAAAIVGLIGGRLRPDLFVAGSAHGVELQEPALPSPAFLSREAPTLGRAVRVAAVWLAVWWAPVAAVIATTGRSSVFSQQALFFSKTAMVTFGGAYSVLDYVREQAVNRFHWLETKEMIDGLGMAETTPGPLIQVVQFVGFMGAYRHPGELSPLAAGVLGSIVTTWVTYAPCFLWIFLGAPYIEYLRGRRSLNAALSAITAAVVGVILNLSIWFALHTLFGVVEERQWRGLRLLVPEWGSLDPVALAIAAAAFVAMFRFKIGMIPTLAASAAAGLAWTALSR